MGYENSYPFRIHSNQFNKLYFSTAAYDIGLNKTQLNPYFITGFCDAESSFQIVIIKNNNSKLGWSVQPFFTIGLHSRDLALLLIIKSFFGW